MGTHALTADRARTPDVLICDVLRQFNMSDRSLTTMTPKNVEDFDIWVFEASDLVASVVPLQAPWSAAVENYQFDEPAD